MNKFKYLLPAAVLIAITTLICPAAGSQKKTEPNRPTVEQIWKQFAQSRQNMNSFKTEYQTAAKYSYSRGNLKGQMYIKFCDKFDGNRCKTTQFIWGNVGGKNIIESKADYWSDLWDGENLYTYNRSSANAGNVFISRRNDSNEVIKNGNNLIKSGISGQIMGYPWGNYERINELWKSNSKQFKLREKTENIRGSDCYVIDADIKGMGKYTIWVDPVHNYHITKIYVQRRENDRIWTNKLKKGDYSNEIFEILQYQKVGDSWFPKECTKSIKGNNSGNIGNDQTSITITNVVFNPDHNALKSFSTDDIVNGAAVNLPALFPKNTFIWQDGKVVDKGRNVIMDFTEKNK